ncbi:MAG: N-acetyltransferase [Spirochaetaceae bacterium]|nr:MAG: N-acetyltransferase [Spirochaetaceae bacterium]
MVQSLSMRRVVLVTERLLIRELPPAAAAAVAAFHHESAHFHRRWEPSRSPGYFEPAHHRDLLKRERRTDQVIHLWMFLRDDAASRRRVSRGWRGRSIVGSVTLTAIVRGAFQNCVLGYKIDARHARRGYMREALTATLDHTFGELGLHRVEISVMPDNAASISLATGLGFVLEGTSRKFLKIQERWEDHLRMSLIDEEWRQQRLSAKPSP